MEKTTPMAPVPCLKPDVDGKKLEKVVLFVGEVVDYKIPEKLFSACGTGGTSQMELNLFKLVGTFSLHVIVISSLLCLLLSRLSVHFFFQIIVLPFDLYYAVHLRDQSLSCPLRVLSSF